MSNNTSIRGLRKVIRGLKPLLVRDDGLIVARGYRIFATDHSAELLRYIGTIDVGLTKSIGIRIRLLSRLLRLGIHNAVAISGNEILIVENKKIWKMNLDNGSSRLDHIIRRGKRPLTLCHVERIEGFEDGVYYGEYFDNLPKSEIRVWHRNRQGMWKVAYTFAPGIIEHVHAIVPDQSKRYLWILTGDGDESAGLWIAKNGFRNVQAALLGSQRYRGTWLFFKEGKAYFATDTNTARNDFMELSCVGDKFQIRPKFVTEGSSIYHYNMLDRLVFSTSVEPGKPSGSFFRDIFETRRGDGIISDHAHVYVGEPDGRFRVVLSLKKDMYPFRLFQFGSVMFPAYVGGPKDRIVCYGVAVNDFEDCLLIIDI